MAIVEPSELTDKKLYVCTIITYCIIMHNNTTKKIPLTADVIFTNLSKYEGSYSPGTGSEGTSKQQKYSG